MITYFVCVKFTSTNTNFTIHVRQITNELIIIEFNSTINFNLYAIVIGRLFFEFYLLSLTFFIELLSQLVDQQG